MKCDVCGKDADCPVLHNNVWAMIAPQRALRCIGCAEQKLQRTITLDDLKPCPANAFTLLICERIRRHLY